MKIDPGSGSYSILDEGSPDWMWWYVAKPGQEVYPEHSHHPNFTDHFIELED
jgi:hypothetical protein